MSLMRTEPSTRLGPRTVSWVVASFRDDVTGTTGLRGPLPVGSDGDTLPPYAALRRQEVGLGLPRGQLTAVIDQLARIAEPRRALPAIARPLNPRWYSEVQELIEKALSTDRMSGIEWDDLSAELARQPDILLRGDDWEGLLSRVTLESEVTTGLECTLRLEASARLAAHPRSSPHVTELARRAVGDPTSQMLYGVDLVKYSADPATAGVLLRVLADPGRSEQRVWTALNALEQIVRLDGVAIEQRALAGMIALDLLRDPGAPLRTHRAAASFLDAVDPLTRQRLAAALRPDQRGRVARILEQGSVMTPEEREETAARVDARLEPTLGLREGWAPPLLELVDLASSSAYLEERSTALEALKLLPQGRALGAAYAAELRARCADGHGVVADDLLARLSWLVQREDVPHLLELALDPDVDAVTARQASNAVGNAPAAGSGVAAPTPESIVQSIASEARSRIGPVGAAASRSVRLEGPMVGPVARGYCYVLGMNGRFDILDDLLQQVSQIDEVDRRRSGEAAPPWMVGWEAALTWWVGLPEWARPLPA